MTPSRLSIIFTLVLLALLFVPVGSAAAYEFETGNMDTAIDVPDRKDTVFGTGKITYISTIDQGESITVDTTHSDYDYNVVFWNEQGQTVAGPKVVNDTNNGRVTFSPSDSAYGSYSAVIRAFGDVKKLHPIIIKKHDVSLSPQSTTVTKGNSVEADITIPGGTSNQIKAILGDDSTRKRVDATHDDGNTYSVSISTSDFSTGTYKLSGIVVEEGAAADGRDNLIGYSDPTSITIESSQSDDENDDDSTDDGSTDEESETTSGGGQGGGGQGGGGGGGGGGGPDNSPPDPQDVKNTLNFVDPVSEKTISSTPSESSESSESTIETDSSEAGNTVQSVEFSDDIDAKVTTTNYGEPPQTLEEELINSISIDQDNVKAATPNEIEWGTEEDSDAVSSTSADSSASDTSPPPSATEGNNIDVVALSDITSDQEIDEMDTTASVTISVDADEVSNPNQLTIYKEEYVFSAQEEQWIELETTTTETQNGRINVTGTANGFSLFVVAEQQADDDESVAQIGQNATGTSDKTDSGTFTDDSIPGFGVVISIIALLTVAIIITLKRTQL
jgi:PGF-CTERM protein